MHHLCKSGAFVIAEAGLEPATFCGGRKQKEDRGLLILVEGEVEYRPLP